MSVATLWAKKGLIQQRKARVWDPSVKEWINPINDETGAPVMERVPATGKVGLVRVVADIEGLKPQREPRSIPYLRADGHVTNNVIRAAAASQPGTDNSFAMYTIAKAKHEGWIQVGTCPIDEVQRGNIRAQSIADKGVRAAVDKHEVPCARSSLGVMNPSNPPCPHFIAEEAARKERRGTLEAKREVARKSVADIQAEKQTEAIRDFVDVQRIALDRQTSKPTAKQEAAPK